MRPSLADKEHHSVLFLSISKGKNLLPFLIMMPEFAIEMLSMYCTLKSAGNPFCMCVCVCVSLSFPCTDLVPVWVSILYSCLYFKPINANYTERKRVRESAKGKKRTLVSVVAIVMKSIKLFPLYVPPETFFCE